MKRILITGCSTGFGFDAAKYLADKGNYIYASMRNVKGKNAEAAASLSNHASAKDGKIEVLDIDVTSDESVSKAVAQIEAVDVLINNAGRGYGGPVEAFTSKEILDQLDLNIVGTQRMAKAVIPGMRKKSSGLIIQVSSTAGRGAFPGFGVYHASKWGLEGMSEAMRYELAPFGIDVAIVEPGPFETNFFGSMISSDDDEINKAYQHVAEFSQGFGQNVMSMFADKDAPTDPIIVSQIFERLINAPAGKRPLRTIAGLDFGFQALNDAVEPIRLGALEAMGISNLDGAKGQ